MSPSAYTDPLARRRTVLVAVMATSEDLQRAASEGWYRIPQRRAPHRIGADYLAFYQTGAFKGKPEAHTVTYYAPVRRYTLLTRRELLPAEPDHPRAEDYYFRIDIGPLLRLDRPVPAARLRRVSFIYTTLDRLLTASDVRELYYKNDSFQTLWQALRESRLRPLRNRLAGEWPVDIALRAQAGYLGIHCLEDDAVQEGQHHLAAAPWTLLHFSSNHIQQDLDGCLRQIGATLIDLGGSR
jgi:very-short-patch-repair endonuclease